MGKFRIPKEHREGTISNVENLAQVPVELITALEIEILDYIKTLDKLINEGPKFGGIELGVPRTNIPMIKEKYIKLASENLKSRGFKRHISVSRHTINDFVEALMEEVENGPKL